MPRPDRDAGEGDSVAGDRGADGGGGGTDNRGDQGGGPGVTGVADRYVAALAELDADAARALGQEPRSVLPPVDLATLQASRDLAASTLSELAGAVAHGSAEHLLSAALTERLRCDVMLFDSGFTPGLVAPLASPAHAVMHALTTTAPEQLIDALEAVPSAFTDLRDRLEATAADGYTVPARQSRVLAAQARSWCAAGGGTGDDDLRRAAARLPVAIPDRRTEEALTGARAAAGQLADWLEQVHAPRGRGADAAGHELYHTTSTAFLGVEIDPAETYDYGWQRLAELTAAGTEVAGRLGHDTIGEAEAALDADPAGRIAVGPELIAWIEQRVDTARATVNGVVLDLPPGRLSRVEGRLAAPGSGAIFYSPPDPAGTRPGQVVWSTPVGASHLPVWREVSTVHHEGIPGHHLQHAVTMTREELHPWQRHLCHVHGYAEGWAHYTEGRAEPWGLLRDDGERLGVILAQRWRAARIVVDLGLHLGLRIPEGNGFTSAPEWTPAVAREVLVTATGMDPGTARFEVDRYLGWPGQALAFCIGARLWEQARTQALGSTPTTERERAFHARALALGPMGLGPLREALGHRSSPPVLAY